jgi:hypothetical protein
MELFAGTGSSSMVAQGMECLWAHSTQQNMNINPTSAPNFHDPVDD